MFKDNDMFYLDVEEIIITNGDINTSEYLSNLFNKVGLLQQKGFRMDNNICYEANVVRYVFYMLKNWDNDDTKYRIKRAKNNIQIHIDKGYEWSLYAMNTFNSICDYIVDSIKKSSAKCDGDSNLNDNDNDLEYLSDDYIIDDDPFY